MASCVRIRNVALPAKLLSTTSYLTLQHHLRNSHVSPLVVGQPPLRSLSSVSRKLASFLGLRRRHYRLQAGGAAYTACASFASEGNSAPVTGKSIAEASRKEAAEALQPEVTATLENPISQSAPPDEPHVPVLLTEVVDHFAGKDLAVFVDGTLGAAGHACAILDAHPELHTFIGLDVDPRAHSEAKRKIDHVRFGGTGAERPLNLHLIKSNFENVLLVLKNISAGLDKGGVNGMLLDLGVSSMQVDEAERGFSFLRDGPLDMRMNPGLIDNSQPERLMGIMGAGWQLEDSMLDGPSSSEAEVTAEQIVNDWSEDRLGKTIRDYGEERYWKSIARRIADARTVSRIRTTGELVGVVGGPRPGRRKGGASKGIHPATRTFQALRIAVNDELGVLERGLPRAIECLAPGGRLAVISFHSLEDRIVKRAFLAAAGRPYVEEQDEIAYSTSNLFTGKEALKPIVKILTKKPVVTSEEEARENSRSRSAKLRVVEKL